MRDLSSETCAANRLQCRSVAARLFIAQLPDEERAAIVKELDQEHNDAMLEWTKDNSGEAKVADDTERRRYVVHYRHLSSFFMLMAT